ncbi:cysteine hydrolase family protein [Glaciimonas soli]|uniref:Isochorismatase family protein n=1 Tax=Glaciimonas soli TaxID=2590999 RepID=A0A843YTB1_9BURK|nr:cysteine hydrolase family protein [Glaciimonas soli]MQR02440.1 isochorismatase family protein [Glaciimonas soli]
MTSTVKHTNTGINMNNTAVLVIDVQFGLISTPPEAYRWQEVRQNINALLGSARDHGFPVIFIQHDSAIGTIVEPFSEGWQLHPDVHRCDSDQIIRKTASDAFHETPLLSSLEKLQIKRLLITGYATEFCVDTTVRRAASLGFETILVADAHTTKDRPFLQAEQIIAHHNWVLQNIASPSQPIQVKNLGELDLHALRDQ